MLNQKGLEQHQENIHKIRYLQIMEAESKEERAAETATPSSSTGSVAIRSEASRLVEAGAQTGRVRLQRTGRCACPDH